VRPEKEFPLPFSHQRRLAAAAVLVLASAIAGCGGGGVTSTPVVSSAPTAPPIPAQPAFSATTLAALTAGSGASTVALPAAGGYSGTLAIPAGSTIGAGTTLTQTASNAAPASVNGVTVPALALDRRAGSDARRTASGAAGATSGLVYFASMFAPGVTLAGAPAFTVVLPPAEVVSGAAYYIAFFDPLRPSLGWQYGYEGPATLANVTLAFAGGTLPVTYSAGVTYVFAVYAVSAAAATPTPAPSISPNAAPTPFTFSATSVALLAAGATQNVTIVDPSGYTGAYTVSSSAPGVATASVSGTAVTITAVGGGSAVVTVADSGGRTASLAVSVTVTNVPIQ
jgi:hypothetical protein